MMTKTIEAGCFRKDSWRETVEGALAALTEFSDECPARLRDAIRYGLLGPGKRIRPQLVFLAADACGGQQQRALPAACAVEMIHAYSLIHDDLPAMDDDDLRRGRPTCHKVFGEALAILAGDALVALAFEVLATRIEPAGTAARCCAELARAAGAAALVGGQAADLAGDRVGECRELLEQIHRRKTAALFEASLRLGGLTADADADQLLALGAYGGKLGLAFQISDDLIDAAGSESAAGKRVGKDSQHGKLTYPKLLGVAASRRRTAELVDEACQALELFGTRAAALEALARQIPERSC
jgi:geranylgeranyl diphosphate synthase type II